MRNRDLKTVREAAAYVGLKPSTLRMYMANGSGPAETRVFRRSWAGTPLYRILFSVTDLDAWAASRRTIREPVDVE